MIISKNRYEIFKDFTEIDEDSKIPKYQQLVDTVIADIELGIVKIGDKIPSINETSEEFYLSRDTVVKAYELLRNRGIITAVKGKGFYVSSTGKNRGKRILLLFNKLSDHKKTIFNSLVNTLPENAVVDLQVHHCDPSVLEKIIIENLGKYDHYVIMPHLKEETASVKAAVNKIPKDKLVLVNKDLEGIDGDYACVYEDFELDIYEGLKSGLNQIKKYEKLYLVFPKSNYYCSGIKTGFVKFSEIHGFEWDIVEDTKVDIKEGELYIVIEEADLVEIIKQTTSKNLKLGQDVGLISYNSTPFKEILAGGISVLSTDFEKMGNTIAGMMLNKRKDKVKNPFSFVKRNSI